VRGNREQVIGKHPDPRAVDDTHTQVYRVNFIPSNIDKSPADEILP